MKTQEEVQKKIDSLKAIGSPVALAKARELEWVSGLEPEEDHETDMVANSLLGSISKPVPNLWDQLPKFAHDHNLYTFSKQKEALKQLTEPPRPKTGAPRQEWRDWTAAQDEFEQKKRELQLGKSFQWKKLLGSEGLKEAKRLLKNKKNTDGYQEGFYTRIPDAAADINSAELISSLTKEGTHRPLLDIDFPAVVIPSTTPGHGHLYIDKEMSWKDYKKLLNLFADLGIIEQGYRGASLARGYSALRLPWVKKPKEEKEEEKITLDF